ncbi:MAG: hypothetical protein ACP5IM_07900 [Candidatus Bathyarchaeia archaeon]
MGLHAVAGIMAEKRRRKQLLEELKKLNAVDEKSAIPAENICKYWYDKHRIEDLIKEGKIGKTSDGRVYLFNLSCKNVK